MALDTIPKQEGGKLKAVASGTLPSGVPVVVNADGTVSVVGNQAVTQTIPYGSSTTFSSSGYTTETATAVNPYDKSIFVVVYKDSGNNNYGTAVAGQILGSSITFGTPVVFSSVSASYQLYPSVSFDPNTEGSFVVAYGNNSNDDGEAIVGTISGTSLSFGTAATFASGSGSFFSVSFDPTTANKFVIGYNHFTGSHQASCIVGTVSGTSISFGSESSAFSGHTAYTKVHHIPNSSSFVFMYNSQSSPYASYARVGTVSGTSISFGSQATISSTEATELNFDFDPNDSSKFVVVFKNSSNYGSSIAGTVSGTSISFGTAVVYNSGLSYSADIAHNPSNSGEYIVVYRNSSNFTGQSYIGTRSGTTLTYAGPYQWESANASNISIAYTKDAKAVINYTKPALGASILVQFDGLAPNLTSENYIGMSGGAIEVESGTQAIGSPVVFESANSIYSSATFDSSNNKVVIAYRDSGNSNYGTAIVGTVSGSTISFGSPVVFESAVTSHISATFDSSNNKVVITYQDGGNSDYGTAIVGTVSGTSISFGSAAVFYSGSAYDVSATFDSSNNKVVIAFGNASFYGTAIVGTVSGTSISFGSAVVFRNANLTNTPHIFATFDSSNNKVVITYKDGDTGPGTAIVGTVSGTSISFGSSVVFNSAASYYNTSTFDSSNNKVVITYQDSGNSNYGTSIVGTVSGTSISFGSAVVFEEAISSFMYPIFDSNSNKVAIAYRDNGNSNYGTVIVGTVSDTSISFGSPAVFENGSSFYTSATFDSLNNKVIFAYTDLSNSYYGTSVVFQPAFTNITRGQVADGGNATVDIVGTVSTNQSGLTAGQQYYVQTDGTIGETPADPSVLAGTALSATKMTVKS
jgi:hypothetical protein